MNRREFLDLLSATAVTTGLGGCAGLADVQADDLYGLPRFGNARLLHFTDCHAQLTPVYFREPNVNIGIGPASGKAPHLVGENLLKALDLSSARDRHAFTYLDFSQAAERFGRVGGFAHLATLIGRLRADVTDGGCLLLDGGDTWQGSATALWTQGEDMVGASNLLGVDVMTGHWEFTYPEDRVRRNIEAFNGDFVAQNVQATEDALFDGTPVFDEDSGRVFPPYTLKRLNGHRIAVIGQAFPYTPIANPRRFIPDWSFGIQERDLGELVASIRREESPDVVVLLSHNGMDVDLKLAGRVAGIDFILGGHTHDGMPLAVEIENSHGVCVVTNAGSNGKFLGVLDIAIRRGAVSDYRYRLLPVFANLLPADAAMDAYIRTTRAPFEARLAEVLGSAGDLLYRRGNFNGTFDQIICDALTTRLDAQIALSPGFRWGTSILPGDPITMERLLDQTAITYPETYVRQMTGEELKLILESVADNLFNPDPYYQQGGDMVRVGGLSFTCEPGAAMGSRISDLRLPDGSPLDPGGSYKVAGWATVAARSEGPPVWEVVAEHVRAEGEVRAGNLNQPTLKGVAGNPGIADYAGVISS